MKGTILLALSLDQSRKEELASSLSHGIGFLASVVGAAFLIFSAAHTGM
jgi:predicted membrane channel-forming protein YqfA (hemolysin III family)